MVARKKFTGKTKAKPKIIFQVEGILDYHGRWVCGCGKVNQYYIGDKSDHAIVVCGGCRHEFVINLEKKITIK